MARLLLLLVFAAGLYFVIRWILRQPPRARWQLAAITLALVVLGLVLTGRAHWLTALVAAALPFLRGMFGLAVSNWRLIRRLLGGLGGAASGQAPAGGQTSSVQSKYIRMTLDHDSGEVNGEVLAGHFAGKTLDQLDLESLLQLLQECQDDEESVSLLEVYLDRKYEDDWKQQAGSRSSHKPANSGAAMTREEALQILGLGADASADDIIKAHRRLMQKLHPDRGGSAYLASKINQAKDILLRG